MTRDNRDITMQKRKEIQINKIRQIKTASSKCH